MNKPAHTTEIVEKQVEKTLHSMDQIDPVKPNPFFYSQLRNRIKELDVEERSWFIRLTNNYRLVPTMLFGIVLLNVATLSYSIIVGNNKVNRSEQIDQVAHSYFLLNLDAISMTRD